MRIKFEWDRRKAQQNVRKHRVDFIEASTVFADTLSLTIPDPDHSEDEVRWVTIGVSNRSAYSLWTIQKNRKQFVLLLPEGLTALSGGSMKKGIRKEEIRDHYDFSGGVRGKYAARYAEGANVVVLDPDVARLFPNGQAVNETLRAVAEIMHIQERRRDRQSKRPGRTQKTRRSS
jgi:uncharacterized DUF497 family protein